MAGVCNFTWRGEASWKASWKKLHIKLQSEVSQHGEDWVGRSVWQYFCLAQNLRGRQNLVTFLN